MDDITVSAKCNSGAIISLKFIRNDKVPSICIRRSEQRDAVAVSREQIMGDLTPMRVRQADASDCI